MTTITLEEYRQYLKKGNKYHAKKVTFDNITFDSKAEYRRYVDLKLLLRGNIIRDLKIHPRYLLQPKGNGQRALHYEADFEYFDNERNYIVVEDVKGKKTDVYKIKKKLFLQKFSHLHFEEINYNSK